MLVLDSVGCADTFPASVGKGASLGFVYGSNGGYAAVSGADAMVQLAYGDRGDEHWTNPMHVAPGNIILAAGTIGVAFRNYTAGVTATVSAGLAERSEPALTPTAAGVSATSAAVLTNVPLLSTEVSGFQNSAVPGGANSCTYCPFWVPFTSWAFASTGGQVVVQSGNIDVGIYDSDAAGKPRNRLWSRGSFACPAPGLFTVLVGAGVPAALTLTPGLYWYALGCDNAVATFNQFNNRLSPGQGYTQVAYPLPLLAVPVASVSAFAGALLGT